MGLNGGGGRQNPFHVAKLFASNGFFMDYKGSGFQSHRGALLQKDSCVRVHAHTCGM